MSKPEKILLLPICGLGDAVWYVPYLQAIRAHFPAAEIVVVVATAAASTVLKDNVADIEVIVFNRGSEKRSFATLWRLLWSIRRRKFDVVISGAHPNSVRVPLFALLSGARTRIGATFERFSFFYNRRATVSSVAHYQERYFHLLQEINVSVSAKESIPRLIPPDAARAAAMRLWNEAGLTGCAPVIGIVSGADTNSRARWRPEMKRWNTQGFAEVTQWAATELGARIVMLGSAAEAAIGREIASLSGVPIVNLCGKTGLAELQWLITNCSAIVCNDTGIMHLAGALGTQLLALFGPTNAESFRPPGNQNRILQGKSPCSPCYPYPTCKLESCLAMGDITSPRVIDSLVVLLNSAPTHAGPHAGY